MNVDQILAKVTHKGGFLWFNTETNVVSKVSKREAKARGIDINSLFRKVRVCLLPVKDYRAWLERRGFELPPPEEGKESPYSPLIEGDERVVENNGNYLVRGVLISQAVVECNIADDDYKATTEGGLLNPSSIRKPRMLYNRLEGREMPVPAYVSYRVDRIID